MREGGAAYAFRGGRVIPAIRASVIWWRLTLELKWKLFVNGDYGRLIACAVFAAQRQMSNFKELCPTDGENGTTIFCYGDAEDEHVEELGRRMAAGQFSNVTNLQLVSYFFLMLIIMNVCINAQEAGKMQCLRPGCMRIGRSAEISQQAAVFGFGE